MCEQTPRRAATQKMAPPFRLYFGWMCVSWGLSSDPADFECLSSLMVFASFFFIEGVIWAPQVFPSRLCFVLYFIISFCICMFLIIIYWQCLRLGSGSWLLMDVSFDVLLVWSHVPCTCSCPSSTHQDQMFAMFSSFQKCVLILVGARQLSTLRCSTLLGISCHSFVVSTSWPTNDDLAVSEEFFKG